jgi:hypothetical protein
VSYVEAASYALLRRRILSAIAICSIVWLASLWLAAALAQAQESPSNNSGLTVTQSAQPSMATTEASHIVLSKVDRSELELSAPPNSATQLASPHSTHQHSAEKVLLPSKPRGTELASLAALASAPSSSLLNAIQAKGSEKTDTGSAASDNKTLVYQVGAVNFVINGLPNSFSVSSAGSGVAGARW